MKFTLTALLISAMLAAFPPAPLFGQDHPLISPYPGSKIDSRDVKEFDEYDFVYGQIFQDKFQKTKHLEGKVTLLGYHTPEERSTLEIFRNYKDALTKAGFVILFSCSKAECGQGTANVKGLGFYNVNNDMRYLAAKATRSEGDVYVAIHIIEGYTHLNVIEEKPMEGGKVTTGAAAPEEPVRARPQRQEQEAAPAAPGSKIGAGQVVTGVIQGLTKFGFHARVGSAATGSADIIVEGKVEISPVDGTDPRWKFARSYVTVSLKDGRTNKVFMQFDVAQKGSSGDYSTAVRRSLANLSKDVAAKINEGITEYFENQ